MRGFGSTALLLLCLAGVGCLTGACGEREDFGVGDGTPVRSWDDARLVLRVASGLEDGDLYVATAELYERGPQVVALIREAIPRASGEGLARLLEVARHHCRGERLPEPLVLQACADPGPKARENADEDRRRLHAAIVRAASRPAGKDLVNSLAMSRRVLERASREPR